MRAFILCFVALTLVLFFSGCANEPDENSSPDSPPSANVAPEAFTRSVFTGYEMVTIQNMSRLPLHANDILFYGVNALLGETAVVRMPLAILTSAPPILTVTVDETAASEFLLSGELAAAPQRSCGFMGKICWNLVRAEVIFQTAEGAAAFNAALVAARTAP